VELGLALMNLIVLILRYEDDFAYSIGCVFASPYSSSFYKVLSVIGQQIMSIQTAIRAKQTSLHFEGRNCTLFSYQIIRSKR
jgi:hypothetical protein